MVVVAVTALVSDVISADVIAGAPKTQLTTGQVLSIAAPKRTEDLIFVIYATSTSSISFDAGANPPSMRAGLGSLAAQVIATGETRLLILSGGRFIQAGAAGMSITGTNSGAGTLQVSAFRVPRAP